MSSEEVTRRWERTPGEENELCVHKAVKAGEQGVFASGKSGLSGRDNCGLGGCGEQGWGPGHSSPLLSSRLRPSSGT